MNISNMKSFFCNMHWFVLEKLQLINWPIQFLYNIYYIILHKSSVNDASKSNGKRVTSIHKAYNKNCCLI